MPTDPTAIAVAVAATDDDDDVDVSTTSGHSRASPSLSSMLKRVL